MRLAESCTVSWSQQNNRWPTIRIVQPATSCGVCDVCCSLNPHPEFVFPSLVAGARAHRSVKNRDYNTLQAVDQASCYRASAIYGRFRRHRVP